VEYSMMSSKRSGLRILENIDNCKAVGVTKTTYSSRIYVNKRLGDPRKAYILVARSFAGCLHHVEGRSYEK
jgi:hypothetical protein